MPSTAEKYGYALKVERGERPFMYSAEYVAWHAAVLRKDDRATAQADRDWRRRFGRLPEQHRAAA